VALREMVRVRFIPVVEETAILEVMVRRVQPWGAGSRTIEKEGELAEVGSNSKSKGSGCERVPVIVNVCLSSFPLALLPVFSVLDIEIWPSCDPPCDRRKLGDSLESNNSDILVPIATAIVEGSVCTIEEAERKILS